MNAVIGARRIAGLAHQVHAGMIAAVPRHDPRLGRGRVPGKGFAARPAIEQREAFDTVAEAGAADGGRGADTGGGAAANTLAVGISEALYNTALGIGTSAFAIITYNVFTTKIDSITYGIDESGFTLTQSFASNYR